MPDRSLMVIAGGLRSPSSTRLLADRLAAATVTAFAAAGARTVPLQTTVDGALVTEVVELRDHAHDITNHLLTGFAAPGLRGVLDRLAAADGVIAVTPVFNASYSGLFKSFFDVVEETSLVDKPVLLGATGGTSRHSLVLDHALRPLFGYLRAMVVPTGVYASTEDWAGESLPDRIGRGARELADQIRRYSPRPVADPFALTTSFEDLLAGDR